MSEYNYEINAQISPESSERGKNVCISATLNGKYEDVRSVYASIPQYDISERLNNNGSGSFTLDYYIPWEAPSGNYRIELFCIGKSGLKEKSTYINFVVL